MTLYKFLVKHNINKFVAFSVFLIMCFSNLSFLAYAAVEDISYESTTIVETTTEETSEDVKEIVSEEDTSEEETTVFDELTSAVTEKATKIKNGITNKGNVLKENIKKANNRGTSGGDNYITNFTVTSYKTGTAPFDASNNPGMDASENNDVVRTFDYIYYDLGVTVTGTHNNTFNQFGVTYEFKLNCDVTEAQFDMSWFQTNFGNYSESVYLSYYDSSDNLIATFTKTPSGQNNPLFWNANEHRTVVNGKRTYKTDVAYQIIKVHRTYTIPENKYESSYSYNIAALPVYVGGSENGDMIKCEFLCYCDDNSTNTFEGVEQQTNEVATTPVTVSAKIMLDVWTLNQDKSEEIAWIARTPKRIININGTDVSVKSFYIPIILSLKATSDDAGVNLSQKGIKGCALPYGPITCNFEIISSRSDGVAITNASEYEKAYFLGEEILNDHKQANVPRQDRLTESTWWEQSLAAVRYTYNSGYPLGEDIVNNTSDITHGNTTSLSVTFENYDFDLNMFCFAAKGIGDSNTFQTLPPLRNGRFGRYSYGVFAADLLQCYGSIIDMNDPAKYASYRYSCTGAEYNNVSYDSVSTNNVQTVNVYGTHAIPGTNSKSLHFSPKASYRKAHRTGNGSGAGAEYYAKAIGSDEFYCVSYNHSHAGTEGFIHDIDHLCLFDNYLLELTDNATLTSSVNETSISSRTMYWAVDPMYPNGYCSRSEDEQVINGKVYGGTRRMNAVRVDDLWYYSDKNLIPVGYNIVGGLLSVRGMNHDCSSKQLETYLNIPLRFSDNAEAYDVAVGVNSMYVWSDYGTGSLHYHNLDDNFQWADHNEEQIFGLDVPFNKTHQAYNAVPTIVVDDSGENMYLNMVAMAPYLTDTDMTSYLPRNQTKGFIYGYNVNDADLTFDNVDDTNIFNMQAFETSSYTGRREYSHWHFLMNQSNIPLYTDAARKNLSIRGYYVENGEYKYFDIIHLDSQKYLENYGGYPNMQYVNVADGRIGRSVSYPAYTRTITDSPMVAYMSTYMHQTDYVVDGSYTYNWMGYKQFAGNDIILLPFVSQVSLVGEKHYYDLDNNERYPGYDIVPSLILDTGPDANIDLTGLTTDITLRYLVQRAKSTADIDIDNAQISVAGKLINYNERTHCTYVVDGVTYNFDVLVQLDSHTEGQNNKAIFIYLYDVPVINTLPVVHVVPKIVSTGNALHWRPWAIITSPDEIAYSYGFTGSAGPNSGGTQAQVTWVTQETRLTAAAGLHKTVNDVDVDQTYIERGGTIHYKVRFTNYSANTYENLKLADVLPFQNDGRGSIDETMVNVVSNIIVASDDSDITYTLYETDDAVDADDKEYVFDYGETSPVTNPTSIGVLVDELGGQKYVELQYDVITQNDNADYTYANDAYSDYEIGSSTMTMHSNITSTRVISRFLSGMIWDDGNMDGIKQNGENYLENVVVSLQAYKNNTWMTAETVQGQPMPNSITNAQGYYSFENVPAGDYRVVFSVPGFYDNATVMNKTSDGATDATNSKGQYTNNLFCVMQKNNVGLHLGTLEELAQLGLNAEIDNLNMGVVHSEAILPSAGSNTLIGCIMLAFCFLFYSYYFFEKRSDKKLKYHKF